MKVIAEGIIEEFARQKNSLFLWMPVFFGVGIGIYFGLKFEPPMTLSIGAFIASIIPAIMLWKAQERSDFFKIGFFASLAVALIIAGFLTAQVRAHNAYTPMLTKKIKTVGLTGTIDRIEKLEGNNGSRITFKNLEIERITPEKTPKKIRLKVRKDEGLIVGTRIKLLAGLNPASGPITPGAFDFQRMSYFKGIGAVGFSCTQPEILEMPTEKGFQLALKNLRKKIIDKIATHTEVPSQSVVTALMTGERSAISDEDRDAMRASGLAHLLAISGMHVGMVAGILFFFSRLLLAFSPRLALNYPIKKYAALFALMGAIFYTLIVGATIPTQRALMMTGLVLIAIMVDRTAFSLRLVALSAFVILIISPESLVSVSFQMSYAAVVALICFYDYIRPFWVALHRKSNMLRRGLLYMAGVLLTTIIAGGATGLFSLYHFQNYAVWGILSNMVAVPIMAFIIMPTAVLSYLLMPFGLEGLILPITEWGVTWVLASAHWTANLDGALLLVPTWPHWIFIGMTVSSLFFILWQGRWRFAGLGIFVIFFGLALFSRQPDIQVTGSSDLVVIRDVQGDLLFSNGRKERYAAENMLRRNGQTKSDKKSFPKQGAKNNTPLSCDTYGCRGVIKDMKVAISYDNQSWREDCNWADIVIAKNPVPYKKCKASTVIDFFDLWREGGHALWLSDKKTPPKI